MGSSGSKRKGRSHLPKVGTPADLDHQLHARREEAMHPFAADPWHRRGGVWAAIGAVVAVIVVLGMLALILFT